MPLFSLITRFFKPHEEISQRADSLRSMADLNAAGMIPTMDVQKLLDDPEFARNISKLRKAFKPLNLQALGPQGVDKSPS